MTTTHFYIAHKAYDRDRDGELKMQLCYYMDNQEHRKDICEYWSTGDIFEAKKFGTREELFDFLAKNPQLFHGAILLEYTDEYLESIRGIDKVLEKLRSVEDF